MKNGSDEIYEGLIGDGSFYVEQAKRKKPLNQPPGVAGKASAVRFKPFLSKKRTKTHKRVNSRRKGINGELEARDLWREFYPDCQRSFGQARKGYEQPDLIGGGIEEKYYIEVKRPHRPPTDKTTYDWGEKLLMDCQDFNPNLELILMWRADGEKEWSVQLEAGDVLTWPVFVKQHLRTPSSVHTKEE